MCDRSVLQVGDDLLDDRVAAVCLLGLQHRQGAVGEHRVMPVDGEQRVLIRRVDVRDAAHDQPGGGLLVLGQRDKGREADLGHLCVADPRLSGLVPDGVGVLDRGSRVRGDGVDCLADRWVEPGGDREAHFAAQHGVDDVGLEERRVRALHQCPGRARSLCCDEDAGDEPVRSAGVIVEPFRSRAAAIIGRLLAVLMVASTFRPLTPV